MSNTVTLDPYYGPENVVVEPAISRINVTEGTTLGPIQCFATCNPECKYNWKHKWTKIFKPVPKEYISYQDRNLTIQRINRNQTGKYRCRVDHPEANRHNKTDVSVDVQYSPKIKSIWFSNKSEIYRSGTSNTNYFNEDVYSKMTLRIESNPDPRIMFNSSLLTIHRSDKGNGYTDYISKLPSLKCEDSGNVTIRAVNGIGNGDTRTVNLQIYCKPRNATAKSRQIGTK
ncbi:unnamed protein product [Mytilus coruscus]|uniref:Ig-like domain-containing protein n=1 Tax=Mytilus coruscus TaxID=42192 RepID=A0A6J8ERB1_MYTCO|nr:unnamed protein product [Mytilus coruscus]